MSRLQQLAINAEGFIFDPATGESFTVNPVGLAIIDNLKQGKELNAIAVDLRERFEEVPDTVERDVADFIAHLKTHRLV